MANSFSAGLCVKKAVQGPEASWAALYFSIPETLCLLSDTGCFLAVKGYGRTGPQPGTAGSQKSGQLFFFTDSSGSLDLHAAANAAGKQLYIGKHRASLPKAGGGFNIIPAAFGNAVTKGYLFFFLQLAGLHDHLQNPKAADSLYPADFPP